jgi:hypothetical protein
MSEHPHDSLEYALKSIQAAYSREESVRSQLRRLDEETIQLVSLVWFMITLTHNCILIEYLMEFIYM